MIFMKKGMFSRTLNQNNNKLTKRILCFDNSCRLVFKDNVKLKLIMTQKNYKYTIS